MFHIKLNRCMDGWRSVVEMKQPFLLDGMTQPSVLAFCIEDMDFIDNVTKEGGADLAGGKEIIKAIQVGIPLSFILYFHLNCKINPLQLAYFILGRRGEP